MTEQELPADEREAQLLRAARALPRELPPAPDPWPGIRARIEAGRVLPMSGVTARPVRAVARPWRVAVAAVVLVTASAAATMLVRRQRTDAPPMASGETAPSTAAPAISAFGRRQLVTAIFSSYDAAAGDLERVLSNRRDRLSPATVRVLEESLRTIDQAIGEARAALESEPASKDLLDLLDSVYRQKLDLLRRANELPLRSS